MLSRLLDRVMETPRESLAIGFVLVLIVGLLTAMYLVCITQVRDAGERQRSMKAHALALHLCIGHTRRATQLTCLSEVAVR